MSGGSSDRILGHYAVAPQFTQFLIYLLAGIVLFTGRGGLQRALGRLKGGDEMKPPEDDESSPPSVDVAPLEKP